MGFKVRDEGMKGKGARKNIKFLRCFFLSAIFYFSFLVPYPLSLARTAFAATYTQDLNDFINLEMKPWVSSDIVIDTLLKQNQLHANFSEPSIKALDSNWHSEMRRINQPLIAEILNNDLSAFLNKIQSAGNSVYTQITIVDNKGLNISQTVVSENYWNVGKPHWDKTFKEKSYSPYISDVYFSDETNKFQVTVSFMIISEEQPIGIVVAGIDVEQLEDWKKRRN